MEMCMSIKGTCQKVVFHPKIRNGNVYVNDGFLPTRCCNIGVYGVYDKITPELLLAPC